MTVYYSPFVAVINESTVLSDAEVKNAIPAFQYATSYHFRRAWDTGVHIEFMPKGSVLPKGAWVCAITDTSDQAGALAYHDVDGNSVPTLSIFAKTEKQYGASWTVSLTHELWEALVDPELGACFQVSQTEVVALETADPVEADRYGFTAKGADGSPILISAYVTPNWFVPGAPGPYSYPDGILTKPLQLAPGGYVSIGKATASGISWTQNQMRGGQLVPATDNPYGDGRDSAEESDADRAARGLETTTRSLAAAPAEIRLRRVRERGSHLPETATFTGA